MKQVIVSQSLRLYRLCVDSREHVFTITKLDNALSMHFVILPGIITFTFDLSFCSDLFSTFKIIAF